MGWGICVSFNRGIFRLLVIVVYDLGTLYTMPEQAALKPILTQMKKKYSKFGFTQNVFNSRKIL